MCERELETEQNCNILTPTLLAITAFLSRSPGLLNRGPGAQPFWVLVFSTASCLQLVWSSNSQSGVPRPLRPGAGFLYRILSLTGLVSKLTDFLSSPSYIIVQHPPSSCRRQKLLSFPQPRSRLHSAIPRSYAPVIYIGVFPILTARPGRWSIYNTEPVLWYFISSSLWESLYSYLLTISTLYSAVDVVSSGSWSILFKVRTLSRYLFFCFCI